MSATPRTLCVSERDGGRRVDLFLAEQLQLSRSQARRLLGRGAVSLDGRRLGESAKGSRVAAGSTLAVAPFTRPEHQRVLPEPEAPLATLAEGPGWVALDKPPGVPVHPLSEDERGTALGALAARHPEIHGVGEGGLRSGVVHRLDVETSGVQLFATDEPTWQRLRAAFREHRVAKLYRAIVCGHLVRAGEVEVGLVTARHRPARVRVLGADERARARAARVVQLRYQPLCALAGATLVEVRPKQGFQHQIRATLAHLGFPIAGDRTYGPGGPVGSRDAGGVPRHMLHAAALELEEIRVASPDPPDFRALLTALGGAAE